MPEGRDREKRDLSADLEVVGGHAAVRAVRWPVMSAQRRGHRTASRGCPVLEERCRRARGGEPGGLKGRRAPRGWARARAPATVSTAARRKRPQQRGCCPGLGAPGARGRRGTQRERSDAGFSRGLRR